MQQTTSSQWFQPWGSSVIKEIIKLNLEEKYPLCQFACHDSANGWATYRGEASKMTKESIESGRIYDQLPDTYHVIHTRKVAEILSTLTTINSEAEEISILKEVRALIAQHKEFFQTHSSVPEVRGMYSSLSEALSSEGDREYYKRVNANPRKSITDFVKATQLQAHVMYFTELLN
jgi:hypothetical protein